MFVLFFEYGAWRCLVSGKVSKQFRPFILFMKKVLLSFLFVTSTIVCIAQESVAFKLQADATFKVEEKEYVIVNFEDKAANELYKMVKDNAMSLYNSPKEVMSENEPTSITFHAYSDRLATKTITFIPRLFGGYYNMVFHFKDGRIKVDAPLISDDLKDTSGMLIPSAIPTFRDLVSGYFDKKGNRKDKSLEKIEFIEHNINRIINSLLGLNKLEKKNNEDW